MKTKQGPSIVGVNLKRLRTAAGLSGRALEDLTGGAVKQVDVSHIESGVTQDPGASKIKALADALGVSVAAFWEDTHEQSYEESLNDFLESSLSAGITEEEIALLRHAKWPWGAPNPAGWFHVLNQMRATLPKDKREK